MALVERLERCKYRDRQPSQVLQLLHTALVAAGSQLRDDRQPLHISHLTHDHLCMVGSYPRVIIGRSLDGPHCIWSCKEDSHLCDHWEAHNEEADATAQGEHGLVCTQILGKLIRDGGHDGLDCGKLKEYQDRSPLISTIPLKSLLQSAVCVTREICAWVLSGFERVIPLMGLNDLPGCQHTKSGELKQGMSSRNSNP